MEFDDNTQEYILDADDKTLLELDRDRVPVGDEHIILQANEALRKRSADWTGKMEDLDDDLGVTTAARDAEYLNVYRGHLLNLIHQHRPRGRR